MPHPPSPIAHPHRHRPPPVAGTMCEYAKNYYVYTCCLDPGAHFFGCTTDGHKERSCTRGPHERYIVIVRRRPPTHPPRRRRRRPQANASPQPGTCHLCG